MQSKAYTHSKSHILISSCTLILISSSIRQWEEKTINDDKKWFAAEKELWEGGRMSSSLLSSPAATAKTVKGNENFQTLGGGREDNLLVFRLKERGDVMNL